jgi:hypothetical protein
MEERTAEIRDEAFCQRGDDYLIRTERWAFIRYRDGSEELYDMRRDPRQFNNLADAGAFREVLAGLRMRMERHPAVAAAPR